eukprot:scaffold15548_cov31-Tisochrysis_lutea.AAC.1
MGVVADKFYQMSNVRRQRLTAGRWGGLSADTDPRGIPAGERGETGPLGRGDGLPLAATW